MDFNLADVRIGQGALNRPIMAEVVGPITMADVEVLLTVPKEAPPPSALKRISQRHHSLARMIAAGTPVGEAALISGYELAHVSVLQTDPAFQELIAFYAREVQAEYIGLHEKMAGLAVDAVDELARRIEAAPEEMGAAFLLDVVKTTADRTGHGPSSSSTTVNVHIGLAERMEAARKAAREAATPKTIEGTVAGKGTL